MSSELEKDVNDEVYEDSFYDNEEELKEEEQKETDVAVDDDAVEDDEPRTPVSFACEDCDYRWDDVVVKNKDDEDDDLEYAATCPMCGSQNVTQI